MAKLNPKILEIIRRKTGLAEATIRSSISRLRADYPSCTINAVAQLYARARGFSVMQKLGKEDKDSLPHNEVVKPKIRIEQKKVPKRKKVIQFITYQTDDYFKKGHIDELNRAFTNSCYTCAHILSRKIIENLIREILSKYYPPNNRQNKELYYDTAARRFKDFSAILKNLYDKRKDFDMEKEKIVERLYQKAIKFKDDANDKTHSWYHLVEAKTELIELNVQSIIELIKKFE
jgi:hypothetical protein